MKSASRLRAPAPNRSREIPRDRDGVSVTRTEAGAQFRLSPLRHRRRAKPRLPTGIGRSYRLEGSADLASGQWEILLDQIPGTGTPLQVLDPNATGLKQYFYRIVPLP